MEERSTTNLNRLEAFHREHVNKQAEFVDPLVEDQYTQHVIDSGGDPDSIDWITMFEKLLYARRGNDVDVNASLQNPTFVTTIGDIICSFKNQVNNHGEDEDA
ncbi:unnamed protein product [Lactuca saligna]|uniref:Uncharacterized protein n=1 Tax=Lactuca saligna TaxID=75948 RepID=A0AA35YSR8_LACSI|nr:unnamed protein product [Lactuca saligna]